MKGTITNIALPIGAEFAAVNVQLSAGQGAPDSTLVLQVPTSELVNYQLGQPYDVTFTPSTPAGAA